MTHVTTHWGRESPTQPPAPAATAVLVKEEIEESSDTQELKRPPTADRESTQSVTPPTPTSAHNGSLHTISNMVSLSNPSHGGMHPQVGVGFVGPGQLLPTEDVEVFFHNLDRKPAPPGATFSTFTTTTNGHFTTLNSPTANQGIYHDNPHQPGGVLSAHAPTYSDSQAYLHSHVPPLYLPTSRSLGMFPLQFGTRGSSQHPVQFWNSPPETFYIPESSSPKYINIGTIGESRSTATPTRSVAGNVGTQLARPSPINYPGGYATLELNGGTWTTEATDQAEEVKGKHLKFQFIV